MKQKPGTRFAARKDAASSRANSKTKTRNKDTPRTRLRKYAPIYILASIMVVGLVISWPVERTATEASKMHYEISQKTSTEYELGESVTTQEGKEGERSTTFSYKTNLFGLLMGITWDKEIVSSEVVTTPVEKIVTLGSKRYQYMHCSDGSYRFFNDEQFKNPQTGFTSKSRDYCAQNNQGVKVTLSNSPTNELGRNNNSNVVNLPADSSCRKIDIIPYRTVARDDPSMALGERNVAIRGYDGYTFVCPTLGYRESFPPSDEIVDVGTGENAQRMSEQARIAQEQEVVRQRNIAMQKWQTCAQSIRSQIGAANGGDPTWYINQMCGSMP